MLDTPHRTPTAATDRRHGTPDAARRATSAPGSPGSERSPSSPSSSLQNVIRGRLGAGNGARRRGARPLRRPPLHHRSCSSPRSWSAAPGWPCSSAARCAACSPATAGVGATPASSGPPGILALFSVARRTEQALSVVAHGADPTSAPSTRCGRCTTASSPCCSSSSRVALLGLSRAGVAAGITPACFARLAPVGLGAAGRGRSRRAAIAAGDALPFFGLGVGGFVIWLAFLVTTGLRLVRSHAGVELTGAASDRRPRPPITEPTTDPPTAAPPCSRRWSRPGTGPTAPRSARPSPTTPTSSTSAAPTTAAGRRSPRATRRSSTRSTPAAPCATTSTSPGRSSPGASWPSPRHARRPDRPAAGDQPLPDHRALIEARRRGRSPRSTTPSCSGPLSRRRPVVGVVGPGRRCGEPGGAPGSRPGSRRHGADRPDDWSTPWATARSTDPGSRWSRAAPAASGPPSPATCTGGATRCWWSTPTPPRWRPPPPRWVGDRRGRRGLRRRRRGARRADGRPHRAVPERRHRAAGRRAPPGRRPPTTGTASSP